MPTQWPIQSKTIMKFQSISILSTNQSLCKSQKLKFDILKPIVIKRFNVFCFNNTNWINESQSNIMNELAGGKL